MIWKREEVTSLLEKKIKVIFGSFTGKLQRLERRNKALSSRVRRIVGNSQRAYQGNRDTWNVTLSFVLNFWAIKTQQENSVESFGSANWFVYDTILFSHYSSAWLCVIKDLHRFLLSSFFSFSFRQIIWLFWIKL